MRTFVSSSQAGQDAWAYSLSSAKQNGTFVDIGCGDPFAYSNSHGLEKVGWTGLCVDIHENVSFRACRPGTRLEIFDARQRGRWPVLLGEVFSERIIDYLSIDCDEASFDVLDALPHDVYKFRCITIEHDSYRIGPAMKMKIRFLLDRLGYDRAVTDVVWRSAEGDKPFEDWWILP